MQYIVNSRYLDYIMVPSVKYIDLCVKQLDADKCKFHTLRFGIPDLFEKYKTIESEKFALAIGRSNRDYDWLIEEWKNIEIPLLIISDSYTPSIDVPKNITIIDNISGDEQFPFIMRSRIVILPIDNPTICSGDTVLLTSMSFMKCIIVTAPSTLAEMYIRNGFNGYTVSKNEGKLKDCIQIALKDSDIGRRARESYVKYFSRLEMGISFGKIISMQHK